MSENNDTSNDSNCLGGSGANVLQASRLGNSNPLLRIGVLRPSVLQPSVLGASVLGNNSSPVDSEKHDDVQVDVKNPFLKETKEDEDDVPVEGAVGGSKLDTNDKQPIDDATEEDDVSDERPDPLKMLRKNGIERANIFAAAKTSMPRVENSGFVFGQNVHERVVGDNINENNANADTTNDPGNSGGELLFSSVIQKAATEHNEGGAAAAAVAVGTNKDAEAKSLTEVAREYEESRAQKRKYEEVETFTGEEDEINIVDINCKLFAFVNSNYEERGRGSLRLNDSKKQRGCSRVVFRTSGNLRLLLNTKVWSGMVAERPSQKSLRLTAIDNTGKIKVFLAMARPVDIGQLSKALVERIEKRKLTHPEECRADADAAGDGGKATNNGTFTAAEQKLSTAADSTIDIDDDEHAVAAKLTVPVYKDCSEEPNNKKPSVDSTTDVVDDNAVAPDTVAAAAVEHAEASATEN